MYPRTFQLVSCTIGEWRKVRLIVSYTRKVIISTYLQLDPLFLVSVTYRRRWAHAGLHLFVIITILRPINAKFLSTADVKRMPTTLKLLLNAKICVEANRPFPMNHVESHQIRWRITSPWKVCILAGLERFKHNQLKKELGRRAPILWFRKFSKLDVEISFLYFQGAVGVLTLQVHNLKLHLWSEGWINLLSQLCCFLTPCSNIVKRRLNIDHFLKIFFIER